MISSSTIQSAISAGYRFAVAAAGGEHRDAVAINVAERSTSTSHPPTYRRDSTLDVDDETEAARQPS